MLETTTHGSFDNTTLINVPLPDVPWYFAWIIVVLGTVGNILVCAAIIVDKSLQTNTNYFLFSLSVTDLLVTVAVIPARFILYIYALEPSTFPLCVLYALGDDYLTAASALHICSISIERYCAIKDPLGASKMTKGKLLRRILVVWAVSFLTIIPYLTSALLSKYPQKTTYCVVLLRQFPYSKVILFTESLVIYIMVAVVLYTFIGTVVVLNRLVERQSDPGNTIVRSIARSQNIKDGSHKLRALNTEKRALRVVWIISFAFTVTLLPYAISTTMLIFNLFVAPEITKAAAYLNYMNSAINPILYTIFNKQFRRNFVKFILLKFRSHEAS